jgi:hypothetical protein
MTVNLKKTYNNLSTQAKAVFFVGCFTLCLLFLMLFFQPENDKNFKLVVLNIIFITILMIFFNIYKIDCLIKGGCNVLGWFFVYLALIADLTALYKFYDKNYLQHNI